MKMFVQWRHAALSVVWGALLLSGLLWLTLGAYPSRAWAAATPRAQQVSTIAFSQTSYLVDEGVGSGEIMLVVSPPSSTPVTVTVSSVGLQAEPTLDFEGLRELPVIPANEAVYTLALTIIDDSWVEGNEQLRLTLGGFEGVLPGTITETVVTIQDNDIAYLSIQDVTVQEDAGAATLIISQSVSSTLETRVDVRTVDGSATAPDDYSERFTTAAISPGDTVVTVTVPLHDDAIAEGDERFLVRLEDATNAQLVNRAATMTATVTILDDEAFPEVEVAHAAASESERVLPFVATLNATATQTVTVAYATLDGSATAPADYLAGSGVFTIPPGSTTTTILVPLVEDHVAEGDENFFLLLTNPVQAALHDEKVEGIIHDSSGTKLYLPGLAH